MATIAPATLPPEIATAIVNPVAYGEWSELKDKFRWARDHMPVALVQTEGYMPFWAVTRHRVQINRLPELGETVHIETWPMPNTHVGYPRSIVIYDQAGNECSRSISLWVLMDQDTRSSVSPDKSGIIVPGTLRGTELALPGGLVPRAMEHSCQRDVCFTDLDRNGHMNNTRYMDWIDDLLPSDFHREHPVKEFAVRYHSEAREGQRLDLHWDFVEDNCLRVDARRRNETRDELVFSAKVLFD